MVTSSIRLAQLGRAAGIYLEVCGQRFGSELGKGTTMLRAQLTGRVVHRVNDETSANMALRRHRPGRGPRRHSIPAERPGIAIAGDSSGGWSRIRAPHLTLGEAATVCRDTAAPGPGPARARRLPARRSPSSPAEPLPSPLPPSRSPGHRLARSLSPGRRDRLAPRPYPSHA